MIVQEKQESLVAVERGVVTCLPLTCEEEYDFLADVNAAIVRGELTSDEAQEMIDREYALWNS
jgi:hypothetical protein